MAEREVANQL
jgi:hypothetical protein